MIENNIISDHFTVEELKKLKITPPDVKMYKKIRSNWDSVAKQLPRQTPSDSWHHG